MTAAEISKVGIPTDCGAPKKRVSIHNSFAALPFEMSGTLRIR
jgi:hypothetical protein